MAMNTERIRELETLVQHLVLQVQSIQGDIKWQDANREQDAKALEEAKAADQKAAVETAVVVHRVGELEKHRDLWSLRWWQLGVGLLLAVVGGVIGYLLKR